MLYVQRRPVAPLDRHIEAIWVCRAPRRPRMLERVLPSGAPQLVLNLAEDRTRVYEPSADGFRCHVSPGSVLTGVTTRYQIIDTDEQQHVVGVSFRPGGTLPFFSVPAAELCDRDVPVESLWGCRPTARIREQLLEAPGAPGAADAPDDAEHAMSLMLDALERALLGAWRPRAAHPAVTFALSAFQARPEVARIRPVTDAIGLSPKRFIDRFEAEVGVTPKRYCRLLRFQQSVIQAHASTRIDWAGLAAACGYVDQSHMIHEFQAFSGLTPTAYEAGRTAFRNHVTFLQSSEQ